MFIYKRSTFNFETMTVEFGDGVTREIKIEGGKMFFLSPNEHIGWLRFRSDIEEEALAHYCLLEIKEEEK